MDRRASSGRQRTIIANENKNLIENLICLKEDNPGSHMSPKEVEKKHRYKPYFRKTNDKEKRI